MPIQGDCPKDSERLVAPDRWKDAQTTVNLFIAANEASTTLKRICADHRELCSCRPCEVVKILARTLKAME
jgi:hypothetical protein